MKLDTLRLYKGLYVRKDRHDDRCMVKECQSVYKHFNFSKGDVVLDFGVNVGGFASMALASPIKKYIGIEADPENFEIAQFNIDRLNPYKTDTLLLKGAASASLNKTLMFYQTESGNAKCSGTIAVNSRNKHLRKVCYSVKNFNIDELIKKHRPNRIKMDIEGAEYDWFAQNKGIMPSFIKEIAFDLHKMKSIQMFEKEYLSNFLKDFDIINVCANTAYETNKKMKWKLPVFGIKGYGMVFALDVFFRRKTK